MSEIIQIHLEEKPSLQHLHSSDMFFCLSILVYMF